MQQLSGLGKTFETSDRQKGLNLHQGHIHKRILLLSADFFNHLAAPHEHVEDHFCAVRNFSEEVRAVATIKKPAITTRPGEKELVRSLSHPMRKGPRNPPIVPIELMKARPPAAATPVR